MRQHVRGHLNTFNVAVTGHAEYHSVTVLLRDEHGEVLGGCLGEIWGGWLAVNILWVIEPLRGRGYGRQLLEAAERFAVERGCTRAWLTTFSFQGPGLLSQARLRALRRPRRPSPGPPPPLLPETPARPGRRYLTRRAGARPPPPLLKY